MEAKVRISRHHGRQTDGWTRAKYINIPRFLKSGLKTNTGKKDDHPNMWIWLGI